MPSRPYLPSTRIIPLLLLLALAGGAWAANASPPGPAKVAPAPAGRADALTAFQRQAAGAPAPEGAMPAVVGCLIWSGRADSNYRSFFQWEVRIKAGSALLSALRMRIVLLSYDCKVLAKGPWEQVGDIPAGGTRDASYHFNCPNFPAYRLELAWSGGKAAAIGCDKVSVPQSLGDLAQGPSLVTVGSDLDYNADRHSVDVDWWLWNLGGKPATGVSQTVHCLDAKGKEVGHGTVIPEKGTVPPGYCKHQYVRVLKVPPVVGLTITTKESKVIEIVSDPGSFTGAATVEVAQVHADPTGKRLLARVRNGTADTITGLTVTIDLLDAAGKSLRKVDLPVGDLPKGKEQDLASAPGTLPTWSSYAVSWTARTGDAPATASPAPSAPQRIDVQGLSFLLKPQGQGDGASLTGTVSNRRTQDITGLVVTIRLTCDGKIQTFSASPGALNHGATVPLTIITGRPSFQRLELSWNAKTGGGHPAGGPGQGPVPGPPGH